MQPGLFTLSIFSDCVHQYTAEGKVATENHIFCRQMEAISKYYKHTEIYCPFITKNNTPVKVYTEKNIHFTPLPNVGGQRVSDKLKLLQAMPVWFKSFSASAKNSDIIYQRFPDNLNIPGFFYFYFKKKKVFATYTGTWPNYKNEPFTYRLQKWLLKHFFRGPVWAYLVKEHEGKNIFKSYSPSYTLQEWEEETAQVNKRISNIKNNGIQLPVFITVGALVKNKNQQFILDVFNLLHQQAFPFHLYIVGDGPLIQQYKNFIEKNNLQKNISLMGKSGSDDVRALYRKSDFLIQAPIAEGFGKVPVEGFFHGVIPLLSNTAYAQEMTGKNNERGYTFIPDNAGNIAALILNITKNNSRLPAMIEEGRAFAKSNNLNHWAEMYYRDVCNFYNL